MFFVGYSLSGTDPAHRNSLHFGSLKYCTVLCIYSVHRPPYIYYTAPTGPGFSLFPPRHVPTISYSDNGRLTQQIYYLNTTAVE